MTSYDTVYRGLTTDSVMELGETILLEPTCSVEDFIAIAVEAGACSPTVETCMLMELFRV